MDWYVKGGLATVTAAWAFAQAGYAWADLQRASNTEKLKRLEFQKDAIEIEAWDKLSTRAILKSADKDLKSYFLKEQEYTLIVRDFQAIKEETRPGNTTGMTQVLNRLRFSPFFDNKYRSEYEALWIILSARPTMDKAELETAIQALDVKL